MTVEVVRFANGVLYRGGTGVSDGDVVFTADKVSECDSFMLMSTAGPLYAYVTLDGVNYATAPQALSDLGATDLTPVLTTVANRVYGFRGKFYGVKIKQNGATPVANAALLCGNVGSRW